MEEKLLELLIELCDDEEIKNNMDEDLFESDTLDSLAFAELLFAIEDNFGVIIAPSEIERTDINTANKIIKLVSARM